MQPSPTSKPDPSASSREQLAEPEYARLSVVIPVYDESHRLGRTLEQIGEYAAKAGSRCELVVVDDGSRDGTGDIARQFAHPSLDLRLLTNPANRGKGYSIRQGMLAATGDPVLMCDADLSCPLTEIEKLRPWLDRGYDLVIGSRDLPDSILDPPQPPGRRWMAWLFRAIRRRLLLPELRDTQCGFKLFRQDAARAIFSRATIDGWLFDCEALGIAARLGYRIREVGVVWRDDPDSRVRPWREALLALPTLLAIHRRVARLRREGA